MALGHRAIVCRVVRWDGCIPGPTHFFLYNPVLFSLQPELRSKTRHMHILNIFFHLPVVMLFQGEPFSEFKEEWDDAFDRPPPLSDAVRMINSQTEIIEEALNQPMNTSLQRRQVVAYLLEQCILLCATIPADRAQERRRFRMIRKRAEKLRRIARGDGL